uniref:MULE transposase domain-containing protein n=1 Tax=Lactuca sativa TaxID=4236 RepID=A0A9R1WLU8_LACSA|nr:hypothetical protein LSAT_V11C100011550 [Lactuca sativa]
MVVESNPTIKVKALKEKLQKEYQVGFSIHQIFRAKSNAKKQSTNPDTTVKLEFESEPNSNATLRRFKRIYVCLGGMKKGFRACLKDFLGDDLDLYANFNFTFISDRQKGLQLFPCAEHIYCLRHIHDSMKRTWRSSEHKDHLWNCAITTTIQEFNHLMNEFNLFDKDAYNWLKQIPPQHWTRSHFTVSDMLLNNLCEVFNNKLIVGRDKPLITCLELWIKNVNLASQYTTRWNGSDKYQVNGPWQDQQVIEMAERVYSCRNYILMSTGCALETWKPTYVYKVEPIKRRAMWPISECTIKITLLYTIISLGGPRKGEENLRGREAKRRERMVMVLVGVKLMLLVGVGR